MTKAEEELIANHRKILDFTLAGFICSCCHTSQKREKVGRLDIFRPRGTFSYAPMSTYMICSDCAKLDEDTIYENTKTLKISKGELIP